MCLKQGVSSLRSSRGRSHSVVHYNGTKCHEVIYTLYYPDNPVSASTLESYISVSGKYLEKIMRMLSRRGIVTANRGATGGYFLAKAPEQITIGQIVRALEDDMEIIECVSKDSKCKCCPTSNVWKKLYDGINQLLDSMNLEQMIKGELR